MSLKKVCIIAAYESCLEPVMPLARFMKEQGVEVMLLLAEAIAPDVARSLSDIFSVERTDLGKLSARKFGEGCDAIFIAAGEPDLGKLIPALRPSRATLLAFFSSATSCELYRSFNKLANSDVILFSNPVDFEKYRKYASDFKLPAQPFMLGYSGLMQQRKIERQDLVFFDQDFQEMAYSEKAYILQRLIELAESRPDQKVVIHLSRAENGKLRVRISMAKMVKKVARRRVLPKNLMVSEVSIAEALTTATRVISVSSPAIIQALHNQIPVALICDFGIRPDLGNENFSGSNLYASFDEIIAGNYGKVNAQWLESYVAAAENNYPKLLKMIAVTASLNKGTGNSSAKS